MKTSATATASTPYILVFKTNLRLKKDARKIKPVLDMLSHVKDWNIDREDADNILRIESVTLCPEEIINVVNHAGYHCEELND
jgi:hypothetical protein